MKKKNETRLRHIVTVANNKGGSGKTTTVLNLGTAIVKRGYRVLVIDTDPQCNLSDSVGWDAKRAGTKEKRGEPTVYDAMCEGKNIPVYKAKNGLYFTPSAEWMADADAYLNSSDVTDPVRVLRALFAEPIDDHTGEGLVEWESSFDFIFIDTQPNITRVTVNAICAADGIIIPVELEQYSVDGFVKTIKKFARIKKISNPTLQIHGILITKKNKQLKNAKSLEEELREQGDAFKIAIRRAVDVPDSQDRGFDKTPDTCHDIFSYKHGSSDVSEDFILLANEYLKKWGQ